MLILALDTATLVSGVAVANEERLLAELTTETRLTHSETLMPHIDEVLALAGVTKGELEAVAVSIGPGSFTGLRIGLATAKALAYALKLPLVPVPTLEAMAARFPVPGVKVCALMDAQKGNVYRAVYEWCDGGPKELKPLTVMPLSEAVAACAAEGAPVVLTGDIVHKRAAKLILPEGVYAAPPAMVMPRAAETAFLGLKRLARGETGNVMNLEPLYVRRSEAEELWEARQRQVEK